MKLDDLSMIMVKVTANAMAMDELDRNIKQATQVCFVVTYSTVITFALHPQMDILLW